MSYGINAPMGFQEEIPLIGSTYNSKNAPYSIASGYATSIFTGDPVARLAGGLIKIGVAGAAVTGIFQGVTFLDSLGVKQYLPYWPASTVTLNTDSATAYVIDDPFVEFNIQVTGNNPISGTPTANLVDMGQNANFVIGAGTTSNGLSTTSLNIATLAVTATLNCNLLRITPGFGSTVVGAPGTATSQQNAYGTLYNNVVVTLNNHVLKGGTGTAGV